MNRIRELREGANVKQADLYRQLKWKQSRLANYERGARTPGLDEARRIVHALNALGVSCSMADVFPEPEIGAERLAS
ncbi:TPA: helix-turn-helix transcriptional regulator [Pseudomonas aeruginosa]|uniref:helix-turn-helix transcriptional regulator n=1 Tax=Pseudomonas aeruginosa TaxID=287 RepID=UPI001D0A0A9F|nr:helix-turn-helix transcriptional regulator [Pseudomonas aeruginosa]MCC0383667.1 helix-turn-helix domain-containing protein [Pseudomonas aeruginosa]